MKPQTSSDLDRWAVGWTIRALVLIAFLAAFAVPLGFVPIIAVTAAEEGEAAPQARREPIIIPLLPSEPTPTGVPAATPVPEVPHVGIIAGHAGSDSGAICPDGLQEVDINLDIARRVVALLDQHGWQVDLLEEFDPRLNGYRADALLSIHADSCNVPGKSGFKVARVESSYAPGPESDMVDRISEAYHARTGLEFDPHTITYDMTRYHAFYEIDPGTPAVIIEAGFMLDDRELLTERPEVVARGIADGLIYFIEGTPP